MELSSIISIAIALSFDSFAVAATTGFLIKKIKISQILKIAVFFAVFQGAFPFFGWLIGEGIQKLFADYHYFSAAIFIAIGIKLVYQGFKRNPIKTPINPLNIIVLIGLSVATSVDAFIVGIGFSFVNFEILFFMAIIVIVTFIFSIVGVYIGNKTQKLIKMRFDIIGGIILIIFGLRILFF